MPRSSPRTAGMFLPIWVRRAGAYGTYFGSAGFSILEVDIGLVVGCVFARSVAFLVHAASFGQRARGQWHRPLGRGRWGRHVPRSRLLNPAEQDFPHVQLGPYSLDHTACTHVLVHHRSIGIRSMLVLVEPAPGISIARGRGGAQFNRIPKGSSILHHCITGATVVPKCAAPHHSFGVGPRECFTACWCPGFGCSASARSSASGPSQQTPASCSGEGSYKRPVWRSSGAFSSA